MTQTGPVGLALARICVSLEFLIKNNFPTNGLILTQFTLEDLSSSALGTRIMHKEQSLTLIIIVMSGNLMHQQEGYYFQKYTVTIFSSNFIAGLIIFFEIVDFRRTVQMQVTWVPGKLQS